MQTKDYETTDAQATLKEHGFRVTSARVNLLLLLRKIGKPLSIQGILSQWKKAPNQATVYRMLTDLSNAGIVKRVDLHTGTSHFEYTPDRPHHHHAICTQCGTVEDIEHCSIDSVQKQVTSDLQKFSNLESHSLEFFGRCNRCVV